MNDTQIYDLMISNHIRSYSFYQFILLKGVSIIYQIFQLFRHFFHSDFKLLKHYLQTWKMKTNLKKLDRKLLVFSRE